MIEMEREERSNEGKGDVRRWRERAGLVIEGEQGRRGRGEEVGAKGDRGREGKREGGTEGGRGRKCYSLLGHKLEVVRLFHVRYAVIVREGGR